MECKLISQKHSRITRERIWWRACKNGCEAIFPQRFGVLRPNLVCYNNHYVKLPAQFRRRATYWSGDMKNGYFCLYLLSGFYQITKLVSLDLVQHTQFSPCQPFCIFSQNTIFYNQLLVKSYKPWKHIATGCIYEFSAILTKFLKCLKLLITTVDLMLASVLLDSLIAACSYIFVFYYYCKVRPLKSVLCSSNSVPLVRLFFSVVQLNVSTFSQFHISQFLQF